MGGKRFEQKEAKETKGIRIPADPASPTRAMQDKRQRGSGFEFKTKGLAPPPSAVPGCIPWFPLLPSV